MHFLCHSFIPFEIDDQYFKSTDFIEFIDYYVVIILSIVSIPSVVCYSNFIGLIYFINSISFIGPFRYYYVIFSIHALDILTQIDK